MHMIQISEHQMLLKLKLANVHVVPDVPMFYRLWVMIA